MVDMDKLRVKTTQGELLGGEFISDLNGEKYYGFLGIPYAKPPVGNLRFMVSVHNFLMIFSYFVIFRSVTVSTYADRRITYYVPKKHFVCVSLTLSIVYFPLFSHYLFFYPSKKEDYTY